MADNPRLEIVVSGDSGGGVTTPQPSPGPPHGPIQPSEPRAFHQPKGRGELNAENVARLAEERADVLERLSKAERRRKVAREAGPEAEAFDTESSKFEIAALKRDLQTLNEALHALGATAEQIAPKVRKADDSLRSDTYRLGPTPGPRLASVPPPHEPGTYKLGPVPERYNPEDEDRQARDRVDSVRDAAMQAKAARIAAQEAQTREAKAYRRKRDARYQQYRKFRGQQVGKKFNQAANVLQGVGTFMGRGGRALQLGSMGLRAAGRVAQSSVSAGETAGGALAAGMALGELAPIAIGVGVALLGVYEAGKKLNEWLDQAVGRYGNFGQLTATERGNIAGEGVGRDIARAQELDAVLSKYVRATFELDQSWEDFKATLIEGLGPALITFINGLTGALNIINSTASFFSPSNFDQVGATIFEAIAEAVGQNDLAAEMRDWMAKDIKDRREKAAKEAQAEAEKNGGTFLEEFLAIPAALRAAGARAPLQRPFPKRIAHQPGFRRRHPAHPHPAPANP